MRSEVLVSSIMVSVIALFFLIWLLVMFYRGGRVSRMAQKSKAARYRGNADVHAAPPEKESLPLNRRAVSKPLSDEMIYRILKNSHLNVQRVPFDLNYLLDEVLSYLGNHCTSQAVELVFDLDRSVPVALLGSPSRLSQVLINLLEEAIVSTTAGTVMFRIAVLQQDTEGVTLQFEVSDHAAASSQPALAARFSDPGRVKAGTLGPYVARALVEAEGGHMVLAAEPGRGNRVRFDMSFGVPEPAKAYCYPKPSASAAETDVLVVERYPETAKMLQVLLADEVHSVTVMDPVVFRKDAHRVGHRYSLILVDQTCLDSARISMLHALGPSVKVVATGGLLEQTRKSLAVDYYLSKPFTPGHLLEMLVIFYGTAEEKGEGGGLQTEEGVRLPYWEQAGFVSDAEIPVTANVTRQDFKVFAGSRVMIVEDNPINQKVITGLLCDSGIRLVLAENGIDALERLEAEGPLDLILMDINMPLLDGLETTRRIRSIARYNTIPIVAFTGLNLYEQIEKMQEAGMNAHMAKPLNIGRIYSIFSRFLPQEEKHDHTF